jgi:hypothetical protein
MHPTDWAKLLMRPISAVMRPISAAGVVKNIVRHVANPLGAGETQTISGLDLDATLGDVSSEGRDHYEECPGNTRSDFGRATPLGRRPIFTRRLDVRIRTAGIFLGESKPPSI